MHPDDLRALLQRQPFRPFRLVLTNNRTHEIRHPGFAALSRRLLRISVPDASETPSAEEAVGVALVHIVRYAFLPPQPAVAGA
jgi:hypothetical protein